jgi:hypothetical protein
MNGTATTDEHVTITCWEGLCVVTVPDRFLSDEALEIKDDMRLDRIKKELVIRMEKQQAHSGIMLLAPASGLRRFGAKPESWLAERVSIEISESDDLVGEAKLLLRQYTEMVYEMAAGVPVERSYSEET